MNLNELAKKHYEWVEAMNWHNKTVLEALALIGSEIGEAAFEHIDEVPSSSFGEELADIMLRTLDLAAWQNTNLNEEVSLNKIDWKYSTVPEMFMQLFSEFGHLVNTARKVNLDNNFHSQLGKFTHGVMDIATFTNINLEKEIANKMAINLQRGTRGRVI